MVALLTEILPKAKSCVTTNYDHSTDPWFKTRYTLSDSLVSNKPANKSTVPPYLKRAGFKPSDFGDGGAFPEIHYPQYPLGIRPSTKNHKQNSNKIVDSDHSDLVPIFVKDNEKDDDVMEVDDEKQKEIDETTQATKAALDKILNVGLSSVSPDSKFVKYTPSQQSFNSRIIRMVEMPVDPMEPPKFKHKRVPRASGSPPVPVMRSPPRPVTVQDQQDWEIPPCISNWKNPKGYVIPLDKRLAADGRSLQDVRINDNFAKLYEAVCVAEEKAREAVAMRSKVQKEMMMKAKERKEVELRELARKARYERTGNTSMDSKEEREERLNREKIREERRKERRVEARDGGVGKKSKITRDRERDISEKVALGMASSTGGGNLYDERLFNQEKGMDSGFETDDAYNVYDKGLFSSQSTMSTLYRPKKDVDDEMYGGGDEEVMRTDRFKADRGFGGTSEKAGPRDGPVEFEKDEEDPFGLDRFLLEVKKGKKAMDEVGCGGAMKATAGSMRDGFEGSGRSRIGFERAR